MELTFCGAAQTVTGSCMHLKGEDVQILIDCGAFQGSDRAHDFPFDPRSVDALILTHAHVDHCGRVARLVQRGFSGPLFMTAPTARLLELLLRNNQRKLRLSDAALSRTLRAVEILPYEKARRWHGLRIRFYDAGHMLGSAIAEIVCDGRTLLFSGDIGNVDMPFVDDPQSARHADYVVLESTHGDHCYLPASDCQTALGEVLADVCAQGGTLLLPAAQVGRTQELLYYLHQLRAEKALPPFSVYVDAPLARDVCRIYDDGALDAYLDREALELKRRAGAMLEFRGLQFCTPRQARRLSSVPGPKVILAPDGAGEGVARHHLRRCLPQPQNAVAFLGSPRRGTIGRRLLEGAGSVRLWDQTIPVRARVLTLPVQPLHADQPSLLHWLKELRRPPRQVFVNHGDADTVQFFAQSLTEAGYSVQTPAYGERFVLD